MLQLTELWVLLLFPLPLLSYWLLPNASGNDQMALKIPFFSTLLTLKNASNTSHRSSHTREYLLWLIWLLLLVAAANPEWLGPPVELPQKGRNLVLALDISGSMDIPDMLEGKQPVDRLSIVKKVAKDFINKRQGDHLGLILFGSKAYLQTPLTFDRKTIQFMLEDATIGLAGQKTALGDAIGLAVKRLSQTPKESRVLILLTDGADNASYLKPIKASEIAADNGIKIYTIGLGAEQMVVHTLLGNQRVNPAMHLDEDTLKKIAKITGGRYFRATNTRALEDIYKTIDQLEPVEGEAKRFRPIKSLYYWPLGAALLLSVLLALAYLKPFSPSN